MSISEEWIEAFQLGDTKKVKQLLYEFHLDPSADNNIAIAVSSQYGHTDIVKMLLADPRVDPSAHDNDAIRLALDNAEKIRVISFKYKRAYGNCTPIISRSARGSCCE